MKGGVNMMKKIKTMISNKKGQGMVEYGLIISLIAVAVIGALVVLGPKISALFTTVSGKF
jgi:pilus assembly protein Flp/PilA